MRLGCVLFRIRKSAMPNGSIFIGKHRLVTPVTYYHKVQMRNDLEMEFRNMQLLRFPYLTKEESFCHTKALGKKLARERRFQEQTRNQFKPDVRFEDRLLHLRVTEAWD